MTFIKEQYKNIIIAILLVLFIISSIIIFQLLKEDKNYHTEDITGTVIITDSKYVIITDDKDNYLISNIKGTYEVGDEVKFSYASNKIKDNDNLKEITICDEELIKKVNSEIDINTNIDNSNNELTIKDEPINKNPINQNNNINTNSSNLNTNSNINSNNQNTTKPNTNQIQNNQNQNNSNNQYNQNNYNDSNEKETNADTVVLNYFNNLETEMNKPSLGETAKKGFVTVVDFLFYGGTIKGHTFNELSNSAKLKVLSLALYFDSKIDKYFPGYKESISGSASKIYTNVKTEIISNYLELATMVCNTNSELCTTAKDGFANIKKNFGLTFDLIKEIAGDGITNLKNWYEIWRGN